MPSVSGGPVVKMAVATYRYQTRRSDEPLRAQLVELAREKPRFGYRRLHVLLGRSGEHVNHQLDLSLHAPRQKMPARQLRPVVTADRQRLPALGHDCIQHSRHSPTGETRVHFQSQTLSRVRIHHAQYPDSPATLHRIVQKVQRPFDEYAAVKLLSVALIVSRHD